MKDNTDKTLVLIGLVCLFLLLLHFLPPMHVAGVQLRQVSILSDLSPHHDALSGNVRDGSRIDTTGLKKTTGDRPDGVQPIIDGGANSPANMTHFYTMLDSLQRHRLVARPLRIAYFSDSYTEGDILTGHLRERLQAAFGGQGVGWVDAGNDANQFRLSLYISENGFEEHLAMKKENYNSHQAGLDARYAPFTAGAGVSFSGIKNYPRGSRWQVARLYVKPRGHMTVRVDMGDEAQVITLAGGTIREAMVTASRPVAKTRLKLLGEGIAYGTSLEGFSGIVLDNFSMRSSSGLPLGQIPAETLTTFQQLRQYDLVVLAFGGNIVSAEGEADESRWYEGKMKRVVEKFKTCFADASILLVGSPDFGVRRGADVVTPESVKGLVACQRRIAEGCQVGFYDLLSAMGGEGSAGRLKAKGMVRDDLFHINEKGGRFVADCIYKSMVAGLADYQKTTRHNP